MSDDEPGRSRPDPPLRRTRWWLPITLVVLAMGWWWTGQGLVSSNDGSHVALARALVLRSQTRIDAEESLTLWTDRAHRDGHVYSDRPPGTAFAALPAIWLGNRLDPVLRTASVQRGAIVYMPATSRYVQTYGIRRQRHGGAGPALIDLQGTAASVTAHAASMGALGLWVIAALLRRRGVGRRATVIALVTVAVGTLWGPYATALFSHVTAATALATMLLALEVGRERHEQSRRWGHVLDAAAGVAGAWAVSTDYLLVLAVVPLVLVSARWSRWPAVVLGALPIALATAAYHDAAFGSPWSIGYDHHAQFEFARDRASTFSGNPIVGVWTLWGLGRGAGVLAQSPIVLLGIAALAVGGHRKWLLALLPWALALTFHRTPFGGATLDHRYLVPMLPLAAVGLGIAWQRWCADRRVGRVAYFALAVASAMLVWAHFFAWRAT